MNEQQKAIVDYLANEKVRFDARYVGETVGDNNWRCDAWRVSFSAGKGRFETDYFTGLGHRKPVKGSERQEGASMPKKSIGYHEWAKRNIKPVAPYVVDVLHSLILDASAIDTSFDYWCADYGYDSDSISAFNTYQACCKIAKELLQVFTYEQIKTLRGSLEDY